MIPYTYPTTIDNLSQCVVFSLASVAGLKAWIDYIPVKKVTGASINSYSNTGSQFISEIPDTIGLQAGLDYIPVYYDNTLTTPWSTNANGYIPVSTDAYGYNMTAAGDFITTPDSVATSITGNITLIVEASLDNWLPTATSALLSKDNAAFQRSYALTVQTTGAFRFSVTTNGSTLISTTSIVPSFVNGKKYHIAVERESATGKVRFYTSKDHIVWTQLGTEQTNTAGDIYDGTAKVEFGNLATLANPFVGNIYRSEGYAGLAISSPSTAVKKFEFDPADWVSGTTFTSKTTGEVWTLNGNSLIYK